MPLGWIGAAGFVALALTAPADSPVAWSPNGEWLAYTVKAQSATEGLPERWLFQTASYRPEVADDGQAPPTRPAATYRLWATRVDSRESILLESARGPLSAPCWSPDGKALAFARIVPQPQGGDQVRYEVVLQDEPDHQRVILSRLVPERNVLFEELSAHAPAWSADGRFVAVALPQQTLDLAVVRADNGRVLKVFPDAERPSWSPDAKNLALAFVRGRETRTLQWVDAAFGAPRVLLELGRTTQAPVWLDGGTVAVIASMRGRRGIAPASEHFQLIRVSVETGAAQGVVTLSAPPDDRVGTFRGACFSFDSERENLFFTRAAGGAPYEIVWSRPRHNNETLKPFYPYDFTIPSGALAVGPQDRLLAFRTGGGGDEALPSVVDLTDDRLWPTALVPDDSARARWIVTLAQTARRLLFVALPTAKGKDGEELERATILPLPGEIAPQQELLMRLRRLGRAGRPICDRPADASPSEPAVEALLAQARLFFDYLRQDNAAALASLDALEAHISDPDARLRLLSVRAQIYVAEGRGEQARETIKYLRARDQGRTEQIEETPVGLALEAVRDPSRGWALFLSERSEAYLKAVQKPGADDENAHNPFANRNLDAPEAGFFDAPIPRPGPPGFPFVRPGPGVRRDGAPNLVLPPGGIAPPAPPVPVRGR